MQPVSFLPCCCRNVGTSCPALGAQWHRKPGARQAAHLLPRPIFCHSPAQPAGRQEAVWRHCDRGLWATECARACVTPLPSTCLVPSFPLRSSSRTVNAAVTEVRSDLSDSSVLQVLFVQFKVNSSEPVTIHTISYCLKHKSELWNGACVSTAISFLTLLLIWPAFICILSFMCLNI